MNALSELASYQQLLEMMKLALSTPFAASRFGATIRNISAPPIAVRGRQLATTARNATQLGLPNVSEHVAHMNQHYPDVMAALKRSPLGQHMDEGALVQNFMMSHRGGDLRDTARSLGLLGQPSHSDILRQARSANLPGGAPFGGNAATVAPIRGAMAKVSSPWELMPPSLRARPRDKTASGAQKCLSNVLRLVGKNPSLKVMMGPPDRGQDTRHFWAVDHEGKIHDPTFVDYRRYSEGKPLNMQANAKFLGSLREKKAELAEDGEHKLQDRIDFQGLSIAVENQKGSVRSGKKRDGSTWRTEMKVPYGYIEAPSKGKDGESIDCYVGPDKDAPVAFVVHQHKPDGTGFDEDKVMLGCASEEEAKKLYLQHYDSPKFLGPISAVPVERLKKMVESGRHLHKISMVAFVRELEKQALAVPGGEMKVSPPGPPGTGAPGLKMPKPPSAVAAPPFGGIKSMLPKFKMPKVR